MKNSDDFIKASLRKGMQKIDDDSFTDRIVEIHLSKKGQSEFKPFLNFGSLIIGILSLIISIGLILSIRISDQLLKSINLSEQDCFILLLLSLIFLIYKWMEEITINKINHTLQAAGQVDNLKK